MKDMEKFEELRKVAEETVSYEGEAREMAKDLAFKIAVYFPQPREVFTAGDGDYWTREDGYSVYLFRNGWCLNSGPHGTYIGGEYVSPAPIERIREFIGEIPDLLKVLIAAYNQKKEAAREVRDRLVSLLDAVKNSVE